MNEFESGSVTRSAAEVYEEFFLPAIFAQWAGPVADAAGLRRGQRVLDVACGTGVLAREAALRVGAEGEVVGLDRNPGMLEVARRAAPGVTWKEGRAESIPFDDASFDAVACQFGLMFFEERRDAVREMARVLRPGGRLTIAVWDGLERSPGYAAMVDLLERLFGREIADELRFPFLLGDEEALRALVEIEGLRDVEVTTRPGVARFRSVEAWVYTDIRGWTLAERIDDVQYALLLREAEAEMKPFVRDDGEVVFPLPAHLVTATRA